MTQLYRQGDVLLCSVDSIPPGAMRVPHRADRVVVAEGELTGHAHAILARGARLMRDGASRRFFLAIDAAVHLQHEEHASIPLPPGHYEVRRQRQYDPLATGRIRD